MEQDRNATGRQIGHSMKLGKLPPKRPLKLPALGDFLDKATSWPAVPAQGWEYAVPPSQLSALGNDTIGLCVIAAMMHYAQAETANVGAPLNPTTDLAIKTYSAITKYDPALTDQYTGENPTDNGTTWTEALAYWQKTGIPMLDAKGNEVIHKITGFAALDLTSIAQQRYGCYTFGGLEVGINCPQGWVRQQKNWNDPGGPSAGGHGIPFLGQGSAGWKTNSWGVVIPGTWEASRIVVDEMYCVITPSWLNAQGQSPSHLDLNGLVTAMKAF